MSRSIDTRMVESGGDLPAARKAVQEILMQHGLHPGVVLCDFFMEIDDKGEDKQPVIVGATNQVIVLAAPSDPPGAFRSYCRLLSYHVLGLDTVRLTVCCIHYRKLSVRIARNRVRHMVIDDRSDRWDRWVDTVRRHRRAGVERRSQLGLPEGGLRNTLAVKIDLPYRRLLETYVEGEGDSFPFDANFFLKLTEDPVIPEEESHMVPMDIDDAAVAVQSDALGRFLERRRWGDELVAGACFPPHRVLYYDRETSDEADDISILSWDSQLEEALKVLRE